MLLIPPAKEVLLEGHDFIDFNRHRQPDGRLVIVSNRAGTVELTFGIWKGLLHKCLVAGWQPAGTSLSEGQSWPAIWGSWYLLPGFGGQPTGIGATEAKLIGQLLAGEVMKAVIADVNMTASGPDLDRMLRLRFLMNYDGVQIQFRDPAR